VGATVRAAEGAGVDKGNAEVPLWGRAKQVRDCVSVTVRVGKGNHACNQRCRRRRG